MTRQELLNLTAEIERALIPIGEKYNVKISGKGGKYGPVNNQVNLHVGTLGSEATEEFQRQAELYNLPEGMRIGARFQFRNKVYVLLGADGGTRRYPFVARDTYADKIVRFTGESLRVSTVTNSSAS